MDVIRRQGGGESRHPGGSPANVAYGLGRLGRRSVLLTHLGDDADGAAIRAHLTAGGVEVQAAGGRQDRTSTAVATIGSDGSATYEFDLAWNLGAAELPFRPLVVHTGSLATTVAPGAATVERLVHAAGRTSTVSYDPNIRPTLMGAPGDLRDRVERFVAASDVVKMSDQDVACLAPGDDPLELARRWLDLGPAVVVVTLGHEGAVAASRQGAVRVPAAEVTVVDTVGAGDSFTAGLLDGLWDEGLLGVAARPKLRNAGTDTLERVVRRATSAAAVTVSRAGANPPTRDELEAAFRPRDRHGAPRAIRGGRRTRLS